jgi:hypothetical protein
VLEITYGAILVVRVPVLAFFSDIEELIRQKRSRILLKI